MYNDSPYAVPIGSFRQPVTPPTADPAVGDCFTITISREWMPYILGSLQQLVLQSTWKVDSADELALVQQRAMELIAMFGDAMERPCDDGTAGCGDYLPDSSLITYAPQDPFHQPGYVPPGYLTSPFFVITGSLLDHLYFGAQVGDVVTGYVSLPVLTPALGQGLARFRVSVRGKGRADIHLLNIPNGGAVLVVQDDQILTSQMFETNRDLVQLPPETSDIVIAECTFDTPGDHHIDVTFLPRFNDELLFVSYGGGIRKIVLCGFDDTPPMPVPAVSPFYDTGDDDMAQFRQQGCALQVMCADGSWTTIYDPTNCIPGAVTQPGAGGTLEPNGCKKYNVVLDGNGKWLIPVPITAGATITITNVQGGWSRFGGSDWQCPDGQNYRLGLCFGFTVPAGVGFPLPSAPLGRLILQIGDTFYDAYNSVIVAPSGIEPSQGSFQMNDDILTDNVGSISFDLEVCATPAVIHYYLNVAHTPTDPTGTQLDIVFNELITMDSFAIGDPGNPYFIRATPFQDGVNACFDLYGAVLTGWTAPTTGPSLTYQKSDTSLITTVVPNAPNMGDFNQGCRQFTIYSATPFTITFKAGGVC